jgi:hypothetical protein
METNKDSLPENLQDYIDARISIVKLKIIDKIAATVTGVISAIVLFIFGLFTLLFISLSAAFAISEATGRSYLGFLAVAGIYTLLATLFVLLREKIIMMPIINSLLKKYYYTKPDPLPEQTEKSE